VSAECRGAGATSRLADRVDLVDEDEAGRLCLCLFEELANAGGTEADEHLDEVRARQIEERNAGLTGHSAGQERLARTWRPGQEHSLRDPGTEARVALRPAEEIDDLAQLLDRLIDAGDVREGRAQIRSVVDLMARAPEGHRICSRPEAAERECPEATEEQQRQQPAQNEIPEEAAERIGLCSRELDAVALQQRDQGRVVRLRRPRRDEQLLALAGDLVDAGHIGGRDRDALDATLIDQRQEMRIRNRSPRRPQADQHVGQRQQGDQADDGQRHSLAVPALGFGRSRF
jgi:hypothetical protein